MRHANFEGDDGHSDLAATTVMDAPMIRDWARPHMAALIERMEQHHSEQTDAISLLDESGSADRHDLKQAPADGVDSVESHDAGVTEGG